MEVKDLILYQISTDRHYKVGDVLSFGKEYNYQGERVVNGNKLFGNRFYDEGYKFADSKKLFANKQLVLNLSKQLEEYDFILRELAYEEIRKANYPNLPSRLHCMYLSEDKQVCLKNLKTFYQKGHGTFFQVVAVKLTGNVFYAREVPVVRKGWSYNNYLKEAHNYWTQNQNSISPSYEILFEGKAEIVEVLEEYEHKK